MPNKSFVLPTTILRLSTIIIVHHRAGGITMQLVSFPLFSLYTKEIYMYTEQSKILILL